jgi:cobaltochelatase CobT
MKKNALVGALPLIAQMLGRKLGVKVEIGGAKAYTDGQTIHLPRLPLDSRPLEILANGFIDHEAAHLRYTDFTVSARPGLAKLLTNLLEDIRIEQALGVDYPGSRHNLAALVDYLEQHPDESAMPMSEQPVAVQVLSTLHQLLRARVLQQGLLVPQADALEARLDALLPEGVVIKLLALAFAVRHAASTTAVRDLALRIVAMLEDEEKAAQAATPSHSPNSPHLPNPPHPLNSSDGPPGRDGGAASAFSPDAGTAQPQGSPQDTTDSASAQDAGTDTQGPAAQAAALVSSSQTGAEPASAPAGGPDPANVLAALLASDPSTEGPDIGAQTRALLTAVASETAEPRAVIAGYDPLPPNAAPHEKARQARAATAALRHRLGLLVQTQQASEYWAARHGQRLNPRRLYSIQWPQARLFERRVERLATDTAVGLLLDRSGSMHGDMPLANQAMLALALALDELPGVACWAAAFPGQRESQVIPLKHFQERAFRIAGRFELNSGGGTPLAGALLRAGLELIARAEPRRLLIVATDGQPDHVDLTRSILARCRASGVEVLGLGIGQTRDEMEDLFGRRDAVAIQTIQQLAPMLFTLLEQRLTQTA